MVQPQGNGRTSKARSSPRQAASVPKKRPLSGGEAPDGQQRGLVSRVGPLEIDWPRSLGYFGAVGLAVGVGLLDPPAALFIAAVPFLKMLDVSRAPKAARFMGQVFEGMAKPVGGDSQGTVRIASAAAGADAQPVGQAGG